MSLTVDSSEVGQWFCNACHIHELILQPIFCIQANKSMITINYYKHGIGLHHLGDGTCVYMHELLK